MECGEKMIGICICFLVEIELIKVPTPEILGLGARKI